ncbi:pentapeptide repeat-containing protein [Yinghuangia soli]|uniref:Pentapeptide repeat-containing protein n=1 Tax=Yinghuangia soli TaxID=2908204 RepID=A0AA41PZG2_9ACTN|nr:pentapeptide repeat-containing protein [Yinghuangia soli]MCF2527976.1 pentapeptide repeat-containing protein [Yinghuangia soli]
MPVPVPRDLAQLPFAHRMEPFDGGLYRDDTYENVHFEGSSLDDEDGGGSRFTECAFSDVAVTGGRFRRARFDDVWFDTVRLVGTDLAESNWLDAEVSAGLLAGLQLHGVQMRRVVFHNCKFDSVNLRTAALRDVAFVNCLLRDVDLAGATLTGVSFPGSNLDGIQLDKATLAKTDLRDATGLRITSGLTALRGATINHLQLMDLAPAFAQALGVTVS